MRSHKTVLIGADIDVLLGQDERQASEVDQHEYDYCASAKGAESHHSILASRDKFGLTPDT